MYAVGLDVDTYRVSFLNVNSVIIIWLFAGNFLFMFACPKIVDGIIKQTCTPIMSKEQSAGNFVSCISQDNEMCNTSITEHFIKHYKPKTFKDIGYYLAGLIEGDGYIGKGGFEILFSEHDLANAYYIKK